MNEITIYHNPRCSKSREALELLRERGLNPQIVEYLKSRPGREDLERILTLLPNDPGDLVRRDDNFKALGLNPEDCATRESVIELLTEHPELMQRPVVIRGSRAVIARPPVKVLELLDL